MSTERNRQLVREFYDAMRTSDLAAFDRLVAEDYHQHNPQAANGRQGLKEFLSTTGPLDLEVHRMLAEDDYVAVHGHLRTWDMAVMDIFRLSDDGMIMEHWDVLQVVPAHSVNGNDMFGQVTR